RRYGLATNYHGITHPSLPNYLAMTSGSTWGVTDDGFHDLPAGGLGAELTKASVSWRAYMEGMSNGCFRSGYPYALKHNPFAYYGSACPPEVVPFTKFAGDLTGDIPRFVWITPGLCNDGHDCSTSVADGWLAKTVPTILATTAWKDGGVLFVTWDEGEDSTNSVLTLVIQPDALARTSKVAYNHYSLLAAIEDRLGVARPPDAGLEHPAHPHRQAACCAQVVDPARLQIAADAPWLEVDDPARAQLDRVAGRLQGMDRLVEADRRANGLRQLCVGEHLLLGHGLLDEQQGEGIELRQVRGVGQRVGGV